uniref:histidine--tRNA ligase n=1 Tax=Anotrichium furcellatum TaxID=41999 RepID=A0A4D6WKM8_9FLOR|nr:Histidine-tRNA ligase [Anotrichium furcellatum]
MQSIRGTKDILPNEITLWQYIYSQAKNTLKLYNYHEIRTPILESTSLFHRSIGNDTDIINKEMYSFKDQGLRELTLRPEGTASIARAFINHKMHSTNNTKKLWYFGPMFRYERPQQGRQRQFHQLGVECIGSINPIADAEVIRLAVKLLENLQCTDFNLEINSIGNVSERIKYKNHLIDYLNHYKEDLDTESQKRLDTNPLRILDSKVNKTQEIISQAPKLISFLNLESEKHFNELCQHLTDMNITYSINPYLIRGLDYYNYTAFEIKNQLSKQQNTICGGGRYDYLIEQLGGPQTPAVGWAIGIERLIIEINKNIKIKQNSPIYISIQGQNINHKIWHIITMMEEQKINFEFDVTGANLNKQIKKAYSMNIKILLIIGEEEIKYNYIIFKWLQTNKQKFVHMKHLQNYLYYIKQFLRT